MALDRRSFLQLLTTGALGATFPSSIARALSIPANNRTGSIDDVEHIVFMMQENRSFDHYFGTLSGVRGFGDPRAVTLPSGKSVFHQPHGGNNYILPFHPGAPNLGLQFIQDLAHDWDSTHAAWNQGNHDQWVPQKGTTTMAHLTRSDIPYHYALADAFTVCDAYHCSLLGPTDPNRYHMWTGWVGNDGKKGGPVVDNAEAGYDWSTYPERLQKAGVSWKIYQDAGLGLNASQFWGYTDDAYIGNYGDNSLLYFHQYQNAPQGSPLAEKARTGTNIVESGTLFDIFKQDVTSGNLPQVSWVVAPEAYTEHPNWPANYGAWYFSQLLDILTANPDVWSKTVFILMYDENDGFFDHMVPPTPPQTRSQGLSTVDITNEIFPGSSSYPAGPYGLGVRVPMVVISPWSKGGYVNSELFDHTSLIRFVEKRFGTQYPGITEPNITKWRRAVTGDLTSAFNFKTPNDAKVPLPSTVAYLPPDNNRHPDYVPTPPADQALPIQEPGTRPARTLPYELHVHGRPDLNDQTLTLDFKNPGKAAVVYQVRSGNTKTGPWTYTVGAGTEVSDIWNLSTNPGGEYDLSVYGPNGFLRSFRGKTSGQNTSSVHVTLRDENRSAFGVEIVNHGAETKVVIVDAYTNGYTDRTLKPNETFLATFSLAKFHNWYDLIVKVSSDDSFYRRFAGHIETGEDSITDPAIGASIQHSQITEISTPVLA
ncbi:phosphocholine-specific phospholipase C [Tunturibacter empetritectus]|uniref:phospholipase C n=1 Tax=Tunturiibacter lichenicola TaxID=2051959 RepID=A0A7W8J7I8_9BACT|nr:phospholipase C, phosphocholine-specific [Edaphobacter lichenicola]MBB5343990.1 phospholipase C [Edaphobacter lichenicola]